MTPMEGISYDDLKAITNASIGNAKKLLDEDVPEGVEAWLRAARQGVRAMQDILASTDHATCTHGANPAESVFAIVNGGRKA
jgi:hypothetical protein